MSDDIFIKHGLGAFQQPYIGRTPTQSQQPNIRNAQEPNIRNAQQPNIRDQQEPNIRNTQQPSTYNHRSPLTYDHRSPFTYQLRTPSRQPATYQARQPLTYDHRSPSTYRNPVIYRTPASYDHRSPLTYDHRSPFTYDHRSPFTYDHRSPFTYSHASPYIANGQQPTIKNAQQPNIRNQQEPNIRNAQEPNIRNSQTPYTFNVQTPSITQSPIIYDAIDGDTTGPSGSASGWGPSHSSQTWMTWQTRTSMTGQPQAFAQMGFKYQTSATTAPLSGTSSSGTRGDVEVKWYGGTNAAFATVYYDFIQLYDNGQNPTIDDTWAWDIKYDHQISGSSSNSQTGGSNNSGSYGPNQANGGNWTNGAWVSLYTGSSSAGSYNGTVTGKYTSWLAQTATSGTGNAHARSLGSNTYDIRITKSGQTTIYTNYTHGSVSCTANRGMLEP
tara:strand:- start:304 stop:1626 length:1323 start_codon:yes stop_codon:yes gene_type:complete